MTFNYIYDWVKVTQISHKYSNERRKDRILRQHTKVNWFVDGSTIVYLHTFKLTSHVSFEYIKHTHNKMMY